MSVETNMITFLTYCSEDQWDLGTVAGDVLVGCIVFGIIMGTLVFSPLGDICGRRAIIFFSTACLVVFGVVSAWAPSFWIFVVLRTCVGFFEGAWTVALSYILELVPTDTRGRFTMCANVAWGFGSVFVAALAWLVIPTLGWRWFTSLSMLPFAVNLVPLYLLPESPRWLLSQDREEDALASLASIAKTDECEMPCSELIPTAQDIFDVDIPREDMTFGFYVKRMWSSYKELLSPELRWLTSRVWAAISFIIGGYAALVMFDVDVLSEELGLDVYSATYAVLEKVLQLSPLSVGHAPKSVSLLSGSVGSTCTFEYEFILWVATSEILGAVLMMPFIDRPNLIIGGGRVGSQVVSYALATIAAVVCGYDVPGRLVFAYAARGLACGGSGVLMIQIPELYNTAQRVTAVGASSIASYPGLGIATAIIYSGWSDSAMMWIAAIALACGLGFTASLPETAEQKLD